MFPPHLCCVSMDVCFVLFIFCLYMCVCVCLQFQGPLREFRSIRPGASGLPYYCPPLVCVHDAVGVLAVWRQNTQKTNFLRKNPSNGLDSFLCPRRFIRYAPSAESSDWVGSSPPKKERKKVGPGFYGPQHYCSPFACVPDVLGGLAVWRHNKPKIERPGTVLGSYVVNRVLTTQLVQWLRPIVDTFTSLVLTSIEWFIFRTLLGATKITQCRTPAQFLGNAQLPTSLRAMSKILRFVDKPEFCDARLLRVTGSGVQDSMSMEPRFRNANLSMTHVLDSCAKLLAVLHISNAYIKCTGSISGLYFGMSAWHFLGVTHDKNIQPIPKKTNSNLTEHTTTPYS